MIQQCNFHNSCEKLVFAGVAKLLLITVFYSVFLVLRQSQRAALVLFHQRLSEQISKMLNRFHFIYHVSYTGRHTSLRCSYLLLSKWAINCSIDIDTCKKIKVS